ncbi:MAG TPA: FAD-dependent oxidoreductase [Candidatus Handelsmanbacteria bacterium]|nr:FAD-dependent oxidoreductase [Candidatus Handelsmanbacteria bacterium]
MKPRPVDVLVVGAGVVGVCSAWFLQQAGARVVLVDQGAVCSGSSHGNAGLIVPSHCVPLAEPAALAQGLRWLFRPDSPFYIKPRLDADLLRWLWRFRRAATAASRCCAICIWRVGPCMRSSPPPVSILNTANVVVCCSVTPTRALPPPWKRVTTCATQGLRSKNSTARASPAISATCP